MNTEPGLQISRPVLAMGAILMALVFAILPTPGRATSEAALWQALRSGEAFAILRHEYAPGTGDPDNFKIGDCMTQRNLDDTGRRQAAATGERFRANGIANAELYSSQWCRCLETATLMALGKVNELPALNSFFDDMSLGEPQTKSLEDWLAQRQPGGPLVLVSHQVNIRALTGVSTRSGEIVVARRSPDGSISVLGKL